MRIYIKILNSPVEPGHHNVLHTALPPCLVSGVRCDANTYTIQTCIVTNISEYGIALEYKLYQYTHTMRWR